MYQFSYLFTVYLYILCADCNVYRKIVYFYKIYDDVDIHEMR